MARPVAREALVVVFPTPPLPEVTTIISAVNGSSPHMFLLLGPGVR
jgi:hypothetical protein